MIDDAEICYECTGYGDDYHFNESHWKNFKHYGGECMETVDVYKEGNHYFKIWLDENGMIQRELLKVEKMSMPYDGIELAIKVINKYIDEMHHENASLESDSSSSIKWVSEIRERTLDEILINLNVARDYMSCPSSSMKDMDRFNLLRYSYSSMLALESHPVKEYDDNSNLGLFHKKWESDILKRLRFRK